MQLLAAERVAPAAHQHAVEQREVDAEQHHEERDDRVNYGAVKRADAAAVVAEAARARRAHGMDGRVIGRHPRDDERRQLDHGQRAVNQVEDLGRIAHLGYDLAQAGTGAFRPHQVRGASRHLRQQRQGEHQHAHAADPVGEAAPEHHAAGQPVKVAHQRGARGGKAGYRLEKGVDIVGNQAGDHKGQRAKGAEQHPREGHHQKALAGAQVLLSGMRKPPGGEAQRRQQSHAAQQGEGVAVAVKERNGQRGRHGQRLDQQNRAQQAQDQSFVHLRITSFKSLMPLSQAITTTRSPASMWSLPKGTITLPCLTMTATSVPGRMLSLRSGMPI